MTARHYAAIIAAMLLSCLECANGAHAAEPISAGQLCEVQHALRWREPAWEPAQCVRVADAINRTPDPAQMLAVAIVESDLRERAQRVTLLADGRLARDLGLCGVRCVTNPEDKPSERDRCTNGSARGLYARQLLDPATNIRTAAAVLASHGGSLRGYSGSTRDHGYEARIAAIVAALGGIEVRVSGARMRKLVRQIIYQEKTP
jgi:hypothetical protein